MTNKEQDSRMKRYEAEIREKPFAIIYLCEQVNFGKDFKTIEEAKKEARKKVKLFGDKVVVCRRRAKLEDGQFSEEGEHLVEFERQIVPVEKKEKPVKVIKVKVERAEVERLLKEREEKWKKEHEEWEKKNEKERKKQAKANAQKEPFLTPKEIRDKVDAIKKKHNPQRTHWYLEGEIKRGEAIVQKINEILEKMRKELKLKTEAQKEARA